MSAGVKNSNKFFNFRKLKQDFSPNILKQGKELFDSGAVLSAKLVEMDIDGMRFTSKVLGNYENTYECELELDRQESEAIDSNCDCPYQFDCQHLAAMLHYVEANLDKLMVVFSSESGLEERVELDDEDRAELREVLAKAEKKEKIRRGKAAQAEILKECVGASSVLGMSPFFLPVAQQDADKAELVVILGAPAEGQLTPPLQFALRLPYRSKPLNIPNIAEFLDGVRYKEPIIIGGRSYLFTLQSFEGEGGIIIKQLVDQLKVAPRKVERTQRSAVMGQEEFGMLLARSYDLAVARAQAHGIPGQDGEPLFMPCFYSGSFEKPLQIAMGHATLRFDLEYLEVPAPKIFLKPSVVVGECDPLELEEALLLECARPGLLHGNTYYRFLPSLKRKHLRSLESLSNLTIPEPLFGTFVENALPELQRFAEVANLGVIEQFVTLPYVEELKAKCEISYLDGELDADLSFLYGDAIVSAAPSKLEYGHVERFITDEGILARNLTEERRIIDDLFRDFQYDDHQGLFLAKTEKKIVEFMTEVVPKYQGKVEFQCPQNLLEQFLYDDTKFTLTLRESDQLDSYEVELGVEGQLKGTTVDLLWECISSRKAYIELERREKRGRGKRPKGSAPRQKILVLDLDKLTPVVQIFDEIGLRELDDHKEARPLWSLASISDSLFEGLPIEFKMSEGLKAIQEQILGNTKFKASKVPEVIDAKLRCYQTEGVEWLERLRTMFLSGILADDMGLGKTLQAIVAVTQFKEMHPDAISLVVCPTSLTYNWKEEFHKFNSNLKVAVIDGTPAQRKKLLAGMKNVDVVITSYSLIQKDVEIYGKVKFGYTILDEAQHIKNRSTRNAKSVKLLKARHRLILTGTPIENSLDELWSLFDFLMPGLLSNYERFVEKFLRKQVADTELGSLKRKVSPFILRRMKEDVLDDLPPVNEMVYHCELSPTQKELYTSYAKSAREELSRLVKKEGFDKVQIHVLATLTRLKQICCHPAIFAKETAEPGDSAKYDMLMEVLQTLIEGQHKTVIFSQYTRMLKIMRDDFTRMGIRFGYLDGSTKNRMEAVHEFNDDPNISVFLVSLKAGGSGLNLTGADTVIHYDMWWNPAVENQATDRVHRIGQSKAVSSYKLVTLHSIEEKIVEMQNRKKGLVKKVVSCDDEAMAKLTWDEVLELLQT